MVDALKISPILIVFLLLVGVSIVSMSERSETATASASASGSANGISPSSRQTHSGISSMVHSARSVVS